MQQFNITAIAAAGLVGAAMLVHTASLAQASPMVPPGLEPCFNPGGCVKPPILIPPGGLKLPPKPPAPPAPPKPHGPDWGGFGAGVVGGIIGGAIGNALAPKPPVYVQPAPQPMPQPMPQPQTIPVSMSQAHVNYCLAKYKSYKVHTNTFTAYSGQQKLCISPYMQ